MSRITKYMLAIMALTLTACSETDSDEPATPASKVIMIDAGREGIDMWQATAGSRAEGLAAPETDIIHSVGVFATNNAVEETVFGNQQFFNGESPLYVGDSFIDNLKETWPAGNNWLYTPTKGWVGNAAYTFVAYSPYSADDVSFKSENGEITEFTWSGLSSISASDHLISGCVGYQSLSSNNPAVPISMKHLMARLRFCFQLSEDYADLRTIVVKEMKVDYSESRRMSLTVGFSKEGSEYKSTYRWTRDEAGTGTTLTTLRNEPGVESITLAKGSDYQALASLYYEPGDPLNMFNIEVLYDVYDSHGLLLRANDRAVSAITMLRTVEAGKYYDVKIRIAPNYLYILSDQEPDSDGELIIP